MNRTHAGSALSLREALTTAPNLVTLSRLALLAAALVTFHAGAPVPAVMLGVLAGITDYIDGWLARRTGQVTRLGEILDQVCDVALELVLLVMAVSLGALPIAVIVVHVMREIWVTSLRRSSIELGENIPSRRSGKLKAALVGWSCLPLLLGVMGLAGTLSGVALRVGQAGVALGLLMTVVSGCQYTAEWAQIYGRTSSRKGP